MQTLWRRDLDAAYIGGAWTSGHGADTFAVTNPANGDVLTELPDMGHQDAEDAIQQAHQALPAWSALTAKERAKILRKWFELIQANTDALARLLTAEQGKPLAEAAGEVAYGASFIEWFAEEAKRAYGRVIPPVAAGTKLTVRKEPVGVCALITPWNFPIAMITRKAGPALAAGCTVVIKPAEATPLCALALADLAQEAGVPGGVLNVVTTSSGAKVGPAFTQSQLVRKLSFTGSTPVGKRLMADCAQTVKRLSLELGGNAPFIVFDDADLDAAVEGALLSKFRNTGQTCVCANRFYVQDGVYDAFAQKLAERVETFQLGAGLDGKTDQGPLINEAAVDKVKSHISDALEKGAKLITGGKGSTLGGTFFEPTVLRDVPSDAALTQEETFGPLAGLVRFKSDAEAIEMANNSAAGLAAYVYAASPMRIEAMSAGLQYGMVGINTGIISNEVAPFGGIKESGFGREGAVEGLEEYLNTKYVCEGGL